MSALGILDTAAFLLHQRSCGVRCRQLTKLGQCCVVVGAVVRLGHRDGKLLFRRYLARGLLARRGRNGNGKIVLVVGVVQATAVVLVAGPIARQRRTMVAEARGIARRTALVVSVVRFGALCRRLLLVGWVLRTFGPTVLCRATRGAVHFTRSELTLAVFLAASRGLPLSRLIVTRAIPIANQAVTTVAF